MTIFKYVGFIAFLILFPHFVPLPFYSYSLVCLLLIWVLLRKKGMTFANLGLAKSGLTKKSVLIGIVSGLVWVVFMQFIYIPGIKHLFIVPDYTEYNFIKKSISTLVTTIIAVWSIGGFYEEIIFRGFIPYTLEKLIFKSSDMFWSIIITSILFGLYHWQQGIFGVVAAVLGGLFWGIIYKKFDNNLWISIFSHAIFDTITLVLIYTDNFGKSY